MGVSPYINFDGNCREAVGLYARVFGSPKPEIMSFGEAPPNPGFPMDEATKGLVMHAEVVVEGTTVMCSDLPPGIKMTKGDNIHLLVGFADEARLRACFAALVEGGRIEMPLGPQFWSPLYGHLVDRFGVGWQLYLEGGEEGTR